MEENFQISMILDVVQEESCDRKILQKSWVLSLLCEKSVCLVRKIGDVGKLRLRSMATRSLKILYQNIKFDLRCLSSRE